MMAKYLNAGCGTRFHSAWTNIDFSSTSENVIACDLSKGIPFPDNFFDIVYHSHLLEHFSKQDSESFIKECYRVLHPKGVLRVVVPDLEQLARIYLLALEQAIAGNEEWAANYEWILLEMYDQTVRNHPQGEMGTYFFRKHIPNEEFVLKRCGIEAKNLRETACQYQHQHPTESTSIGDRPKHLLKGIYRFLRYPSYRRELLLKSFLNKEYSALQIGRFRQSGEVHQWMYDRYSLAFLLEQRGFKNIVQRTATESYVPNWSSFNLDTESDGMVYKPDSLFMEAIKSPV